jgi:tripartite-type tricarboxylate transporter receptor subunit TctC
MKNKRTILAVILTSVILMVIAISYPALGQGKFPSRPITIIVPFPGGSGTDMTARLIQKHAQKALGQPIVVINKPGAAGSLGFTAGATASPDGYTVTMLSPSVILVPHTIPGYEVSIKNFDAVILATSAPVVIAVRQDSPWKNLKEFINFAKSNPGKIRISNNGHGGLFHLSAVGAELATGTKLTHLPFKGGAEAMMAVVGGHADAGLASVPNTLELIKGGKLRGLAIPSKERHFALPDVPTFKELGIDYDSGGTWFGFAVSKGTPKANIKILQDLLKMAVETSEFREFVMKGGMVVTYLGPEEFGKFLEEQDKMFVKILESVGLKGPK